MREFYQGRKEYCKATPPEILTFLKSERSGNGPALLNGYDGLTTFDFRHEMTFLIYLDTRVVGFASMKMGMGSERMLAKIYVTPVARKHGCASHVLRELRITRAHVPVPNIQFISLCRKVGFQYDTHQPYPQSVAQLSRVMSESSHVKSNPV